MKQNHLSQSLVVVAAVEEGVNSEAPAEHSVKGKAQYEELINAVSVSISTSNSPAGMEGVTHVELHKSTPNISEAVSQPVLVILTDQNPSNARDLFSETLKEIDTEIFKFDSPSHVNVVKASPRSHTVRAAPSPMPQARDSLKQPASIQL